MARSSRNAFSGILRMKLRLVHKIVILIESGSQHFLVVRLRSREELSVALEAPVNPGFAFYFLSLRSFLGTLSIMMIGVHLLTLLIIVVLVSRS